MLRSIKLPSWALMFSLAFAAVVATGCENEDDPQTWVNKLTNDARRPGATSRLRQLFQSVMATTHPANNPQDPAVRHFLDIALVPLVTAFNAHADDTVSRREAIEVIADSQDPRAIPALTGALMFRPGNGDSERVALRAVQAIKSLGAIPNGIPDAQKGAVVNALVAVIDRAVGATGNPLQIRYNAIQALGTLHATAAVDTLVRLLNRPLPDQDISTARAAAEALGNIGDPRGVEALVYGLFLNIRQQNAFPHCQRALAQIGSAAAVPVLVQTLNGQNQQVEGLIAQYQAVPNGPPIPEGLVKSTAADVLRAFAAPESTAPLLAVLNDTHAADNVRGAAGEALSYIAISVPAQRAAILAAITAVFNENQPDHIPEGHGWSATLMAPRLALIGDPSSIPVLLAAMRNHAIQADDQVNTRVDLLLPFASIARHADAATYLQFATAARAQLQHMVASADADSHDDAQHQVQPFLTALDRLDRVISVARDCEDGNVACYSGKLSDPNADVVRKAAYMIAWTTPAAQQPQARDALMARIPTNSDVLVRRSLMVAVDTLSPTGCPTCITQLQTMIDAEHGQESRILSHLDAQLLMSRLRARSAPGGA